MSQRRDVQHDRPELALKAASRDLIAGCGGTDGAAATLTAYAGANVRQQRMSDCQHRNTADFLHVDEVGRLEDVALRTPAWPAVTRALADRQGFDLVERVVAMPTGQDWFAALREAVSEFRDAEVKILAALPDGVKPHEVREHHIRGEIAQAILALRKLDAIAARTEAGE